jgi:transposase
MDKRYRAYTPDQMYLLPPSLRDWLPENHLAYFVTDVVSELDLSEIYQYYEKDRRGQPPYHPMMMTRVLLYAYCVGVFSSRKMAKRLVEDVAFRILAAENRPDFRTLSDFRKIHGKALQKLFDQVVRLALEAGAIKLGRVAIDGSKVKANASKHKAMSYGRMKKEEKRIKQDIRRWFEQADAVDAGEDLLYGADKMGDELPEELQRAETRRKRIREAMAQLKKRAREKAQAEGKPEDKAEVKDKEQYNFTDPESRIMKGSDGFVQGYNAQIAVEENFQLIVGHSITEEANDKKQLGPLIEAIENQSGQLPEQVLADSGYCSEPNLEHLENRQIAGYLATQKEKHGKPWPAARRGRLPGNASRRERMAQKVRTKAGRAIYSRRKTIVEPVFGQIKQGRGFRQFLRRGKEKVATEWALVCLSHNILKMHRICTG